MISVGFMAPCQRATRSIRSQIQGALRITFGRILFRWLLAACFLCANVPNPRNIEDIAKVVAKSGQHATFTIILVVIGLSGLFC